jgi:hypothetical protein
MATSKAALPKVWHCKALANDDPELLWKTVGKLKEDWERLDVTGFSLLETALTAKALACTKLLLKHGVSTKVEDSKFPPLSTLLAQGELSKNHQRVYGLIHALIGHGADVNATDASGSSCLHVAAKGEIGRALRPLWEGTDAVKVFPDPNLPDHQLDTPTHAIFQVPHSPKEVMDWLQWCGAHGANWALRNDRDETPVALAFQQNPTWPNAARWRVLNVMASYGAQIEASRTKVPVHIQPSGAQWAEWERLALMHRVKSLGVDPKLNAQIPPAI